MNNLDLFFSNLSAIPTKKFSDYYILYNNKQGPFLQSKASLCSHLGRFLQRVPYARRALASYSSEGKLDKVIEKIIYTVDNHELNQNMLDVYLIGFYKLSKISESTQLARNSNPKPLSERIHSLCVQLIITKAETTHEDPVRLAYSGGFPDLAYHIAQTTKDGVDTRARTTRYSDLLFYMIDHEHLTKTTRIPFPESVDKNFTIDGLLQLFQSANLSNPAAPYYIHPKEYADDNASATIEEVEKSLVIFTERVKNRISYVGTPSLSHTLEAFYNTIEIAVTHTLAYLSCLPEGTQKRDLTNAVLLLFIKAAPHCGGRIFSASLQAYKTVMKGRPLTFDEKILELLEEQRELLLQNFVGSEQHNIHQYNFLLRHLGKPLGIVGADAMQLFDDRFGAELPPLSNLWDRFHLQYTPHTIIYHWLKPILESDGALREQFYDWMKEHIPDDWKKEFFDTLYAASARTQNWEEQKDYLLHHDIYMAPKQSAEDAIHNERIAQFLAEEVVQDMESEKIEIKAEAIAFLLKTLRVIRPFTSDPQLYYPIPQPPHILGNHAQESRFIEAAQRYFISMNGDLDH